MRVKLLGVGMQYFNGMMGAVKFENGVSGEMTLREANALCASMRAEIIEGDEKKIVNRTYEMSKKDEAPVKAPMSTLEDVENAVKNIPDETIEKIVEVAAALGNTLVDIRDSASVKGGGVIYTEELLGKIADERGIVGVREIADTLGVRGKSIKGLIDGIIESQRSSE